MDAQRISQRRSTWQQRVALRYIQLGPASSLQQLTLLGGLWALSGFAASQLLRFGGNLFLTRLLFPELFGLMALVNSFIIGLNLLSEVGIGNSIIQNRLGNTPAFLNTAWTLQVVRGSGLWLISLALAFPLAQFYGDLRLAWLIPLVGLTTLIAGFNSTRLFTLQRELNLRVRVSIDLASQILSLALMIGWAWLSPTIWALVAGNLAAALIKLALSYSVPPRLLPRPSWDNMAARAIFTFGRWIFVATALMFFAEQIDRLMLGKLFPLQLFGVYSIAETLADLPRSLTTAFSSQVLFPAISKIANLPRAALRAKLLRHRQPILFSLALGLAVFFSSGDLLIHRLYDARYAAASWMLPLLALGFWPRLLSNTIEPSLLAIGKPKYTALGQLSRFLFTLFGIWMGFQSIGVAGAVLALTLNDLPFYVIVSYGLWREGLLGIRQDLRATVALAILLTILLGARWLLGWGLPLDALTTGTPFMAQ
jgi:O-antigen/teichoic acid export membrane protein